MFGDSIKNDLDSYHYSKDEKDWAESQLIKVSNCNRLVVSLGLFLVIREREALFKCSHDLGANNNDAIHRTLSKSSVAIIFENIKQLELNNLDIAHSPSVDNKRHLVTGIIFR